MFYFNLYFLFLNRRIIPGIILTTHSICYYTTTIEREKDKKRVEHSNKSVKITLNFTQLTYKISTLSYILKILFWQNKKRVTQKSRFQKNLFYQVTLTQNTHIKLINIIFYSTLKSP